MPISARGGAPPAPGAALLDIAALAGVSNGSGDQVLVRAGAWLLPGLTFFSGLTGAPAVKLTAEGVSYEFTSAVNSVKAISNAGVVLPLHADPASVLPSEDRKYYRYLLEATLWRVGALAGWPFSLYFSNLGYIGPGGSVNARGVQLTSRSDINGGNWTPVYRRVLGGAITQGLDSGIPGTTRIRAAFDFSSGPTPALSVKINGTAILTLSGSAALPTLTMPAAATDAFAFGISQGLSAGGGAGIVDYATDVRWRIFAL